MYHTPSTSSKEPLLANDANTDLVIGPSRSSSPYAYRDDEYDVEEKPQLPFLRSPLSFWNKRNCRAYIIAAVVAVTIITIFIALFPTRKQSANSRTIDDDIAFVELEAVHDSYPPPYVVGPPTDSLYDNLRNDTLYLTSFPSAGFTNGFMAQMNGIYLALLTNRTVVLAPFHPRHVVLSAGLIRFSDIFDIPRLAAALSGSINAPSDSTHSPAFPIIEWSQLRSTDSPVVDEIGCWSPYMLGSSSWSDKPAPFINQVGNKLGLDISYTPSPSDAMLYPQYKNDPHVSFWGLARSLFPAGRKNALQNAHIVPSPTSGHTLPPSERLACFDFLYYVSAFDMYEWYNVHSPAWREVGRHAHWNPLLADLANDLIRITLSLAPTDPIPPFISVHVRHGDFADSCPPETTKEVCLTPFKYFAHAAEGVARALRTERSVDVRYVFVTSDERDEAWWDTVRAGSSYAPGEESNEGLEYVYLNHTALGTATHPLALASGHPDWYPMLVDAVVQSLGVGLVGTTGSTMSLVAARRIETWRWGGDAGFLGYSGNAMQEGTLREPIIRFVNHRRADLKPLDENMSDEVAEKRRGGNVSENFEFAI